MTEIETVGLPVPGLQVHRADVADAPELLVLQRCCWVAEAIANDTLHIPALRESLADVREWITKWSTWCLRDGARLVGAVRGRVEGDVWDIGRLMVAPDLAGHGVGSWLLRFVEAQAPQGTATLRLFTGAASVRNIAIYERAGYVRGADPAEGLAGLSKPAAGVTAAPDAR